MRNVRVDTNGEMRCWKCGGKSLLAKRTFRSKVAVGVGALLTKKKLKCQLCGEYNDSGNAKPYKGPASRRLGKKYGSFTAMHGARDGSEVIDDDPSEDVPDDDEAAGVTSPPPPAPAAPPPPAALAPPTMPAGWHPDPVGRFQHRWWDGTQWTANVATNGTAAVDPQWT